MRVLWLDDAECRDASVVGGKAAHLAMLRAEHPVPPGFALPAEVLSAHLRLDSSDGSKSRLLHHVQKAYDRLGTRMGQPDVPVAVRSSAVGEDASDASFAGQHETYLNVVGAEAIVSAVGRCVESVYSERATAYRSGRADPSGIPPMGVLVQAMVAADASGVAFSVNPITGRAGEVVINANWGLGESVVGGAVTPDTFIVRASDLAILTADVGQKAEMTVLAPQGTRTVSVPRMLRDQPSLSDSQVARVADLTLSLEKAMGYPVDIEWAMKDEELFALQCRPITTLT